MENLDQLRRHVADLRLRADASAQKFRALAEITNEAIMIVEQGRIIEISARLEELAGCSSLDLIGQTPPYSFIAPEHHDTVHAKIRTADEVPYEVGWVRADGARLLVRIRGRAAEYLGRAVQVIAALDITDARRAEEARRQATVRAEVIRAQAAMIAEVSTPLLPIGERVVVLPLVGDVNAARAAQIVDALAQGVFSHRAAVAIVDITGVREVDAEVVEMLARVAASARLLGARAILTGVRAETARAVVALEEGLGGFEIHGTLQEGVSAALSQATN